MSVWSVIDKNSCQDNRTFSEALVTHSQISVGSVLIATFSQCCPWLCAVRFHSHCAMSQRCFHAICQCKYLEKCSNMSNISCFSQRTSTQWLCPRGGHMVACFRICTTGGKGGHDPTLCLYSVHTQMHIALMYINGV